MRRSPGTSVPSATATLRPPLAAGANTLARVIFLRVGDSRPYPEHGLSARDWAAVPPRQVRLADLITTRRALDLETLLASDATIFGDLFCHVVRWNDELYLEDGMHRAVRAALQQRQVIHARVLDVDALQGVIAARKESATSQPRESPSNA